MPHCRAESHAPEPSRRLVRAPYQRKRPVPGMLRWSQTRSLPLQRLLLRDSEFMDGGQCTLSLLVCQAIEPPNDKRRTIDTNHALCFTFYVLRF